MPNRNIIVIGGSSGATAPLRAILGLFQSDLPAAVFIVLHVPAWGVGALSTVAAAAGALPVRQAEKTAEYRKYADTIRRVMLELMQPQPIE